MGKQPQDVRNKSSPHEQALEQLMEKINRLGAGIQRIEITHQDNGKKTKDNYSGLLLSVTIKDGAVIYTLVNGGINKAEVKSNDTSNLSCWRNLVEPHQSRQFIPVSKNNELTFQPGRITKILPVSTEELRKCLLTYIKRRKRTQ